jgi:hypothetical protein
MINLAVTLQAAIERAQSMVDQGQYILGTGDYRPRQDSDGNLIDLPFTQHEDTGPLGADCAGFAVCWCYKVLRHQPGFNTGSWATVSDDINVDSVIEDARHKQELGKVITSPVPGAWLLYPTIRSPRNPLPFIGHISIIESVPAEFDEDAPDYRSLTVIQCCGPDGHTPGIIRSDGTYWWHHDQLWPKPEHRSVMVLPNAADAT